MRAGTRKKLFAPVLQLVPRVPMGAAAELDVVRALEQALARARRGEISSLVYCVLLPENEYECDVVGPLRSSLARARGMVAALDDAIGELDGSRRRK